MSMLVDMHCHTGWGSGDSHTDPHLLIRQAKAYGLDALCVTEHNQVWNVGKLERLAAEHEFRLFPGVEIDTDFGHVLVFGLNEPKRWTQFPTVQELRRLVDAVDGAMVLAHPFRKREKSTDEDFEQGDARIILERELREECLPLFDAVEMYNGLAGGRERALAGKLAEHLDRPSTGGSDTHRHPEVGASFTVFDDEIHNVRDLIAAIQQGRLHGGDWASESIEDQRHGRVLSRNGE